MLLKRAAAMKHRVIVLLAPLAIAIEASCASQVGPVDDGTAPAAPDDAGTEDDTSWSPLVPLGDTDAEPDPVAANTPDARVPEASLSLDARPPPSFDAGDGGLCPGPPAAGDLAIDELLIASVAGTGDHGEWLEVRSTRDCALDLRGLHGECASGATVQTFDVQDDVWLPPRDFFVIADSSDPAINHDLPGLVIVWAGSPGDVLRNLGDTVTLRANSANGAVVDSVTYPSLPRTVGASIAFPSDCPETARSDWSRWQTSQHSWFPAFFGTPAAPNDDVHCP
jgi:hypothetical protein